MSARVHADHPEGALAANIVHFARALREAGLPVGPGSAIDAIRAVEMVGLRNRADLYAALHSIFVKKHEQTIIFDQAFDLFWRKRGLLEQFAAPFMAPATASPAAPQAGAARIAEAFLPKRNESKPEIVTELDARFSMSSGEVLQRKDFAQMTADEIAQAMEQIRKLRMNDDARPVRRYVADAHGERIDPRATFRRSLRAGGAGIQLAFRSRAVRRPPVVAICDISGSMADYTRVFLHFLHAMTAQRRNVHTFLFGTRLSNVTRALRHRDVDEALALCSSGVEDWSGGTRIASSLHLFNRDWSRRVLGQGATAILFTDGLERGDAGELARETERLRKSCRRLIWLNPLLRYDRFEARALGIRAMLPHVDEFRPIHNLASVADLCAALSGDVSGRSTDPREWLRRVA
jgi:uncharacterized protein with von Willebrand factor type A (vWA) domain